MFSRTARRPELLLVSWLLSAAFWPIRANAAEARLLRHSDFAPAELRLVASLLSREGHALDLTRPDSFSHHLKKIRLEHQTRSQKGLEYEIVKLFRNPLTPGNCFYDQALDQIRTQGGTDRSSLLRALSQIEQQLDNESHQLRFQGTMLALLNSGRPPCQPREHTRIFERFLKSNGVPPHDGQTVVDFVAKLAEDYDREFQQELQQLPREQGSATSAVGLRRATGLNITSIFDTSFRIDLLLEGLRKELPPGSLNRVLVAGPGLNIVDQYLGTQPPIASPQPVCLVESLLSKQLAAWNALRVDLADIASEVLEHLRNWKEREREERLAYPLLGYLTYDPQNPKLSQAAERYLNRFGEAIREVPPLFESRALREPILFRNPAADLIFVLDRADGICARELWVSPRVWRSFRIQEADLTTDRLAPSETYDLIVCTNLLLYLPPSQALLATLNLTDCLKRGGFLVTTEDLSRWLPASSALKRKQVSKLEEYVSPGSDVPAYFLYRKTTASR